MVKEKLNTFGKFISSMIVPNISAFIAWGFITAIFMPIGWLPNEKIAQLVEPLTMYLLPILVGITGGKVVGGIRGSVVAAIATTGVIAGSDIPAIMGAIIIGPLAGYIIMKFDKVIKDKVPIGFEMLVNNFSVAIIGMLLSIVGLYIIGPIMVTIINIINRGVNFLVTHSLLPLLAIFIEPIKILFLNNAINHGVIDFIALEQVGNVGKSVLYLLEANPGPGLGVILSYWIFSKGSMKESSLGAMVIECFGGIHEIYFPYILVNPPLVLASMIGNIASIIVFQIFNSGLVAPASPGSIFSIIMLSPRGEVISNILGVAVGAGVSFLIAMILFKRNKLKVDEKVDKKENGCDVGINVDGIKKIVFACDVGMGSSAMGATKFRCKIKSLDLGIKVANCSVNNIPQDADIVITHQGLISSIKNTNEKIQFIFIENFLDDEKLDQLFDRLAAKCIKNIDSAIENSDIEDKEKILKVDNIILGLKSESKEEAIIRAGEMLFKNGYVNCDYIDSMLEREQRIPTYIGMGIAIPHGTESGKSEVKKPGIAILQYPQGIYFGGEKAYLLIAIAASGDEHMKIISSIATSLENIEVIEKLKSTTNPLDILKGFDIK